MWDSLVLLTHSDYLLSGIIKRVGLSEKANRDQRRNSKMWVNLIYNIQCSLPTTTAKYSICPRLLKQEIVWHKPMTFATNGLT